MLSSDLHRRAIAGVGFVVVCFPVFAILIRVGWPGEAGISWLQASGVVTVASLVGAPYGWWFGPQQTMRSMPVVSIGVGTVVVGAFIAAGGAAPLVMGVIGAAAMGSSVATMITVAVQDYRADQEIEG